MGQAERTFAPVFVQHAKADYECDGCRGEFRILRGGMYARVRTLKGGKIIPMKLCMRCVCAVMNRRNFKDDFVVEPGSLAWNRLASPFKKTWSGFLSRALATGKTDEGVDICRQMIAELGIDRITERQEDAMEQKKNEKRKARCIHREKHELAKLRRRIKADVAELARLQQDVAKAHLAKDADGYAAASLALVAKLHEMETAYGRE